MNRTLQVAQREYVEHLRTKTFWIGILSFPIILILAFVAGRIFAEAKETKTYAVLDLSPDGLAAQIEAVARQGDVQIALRGAFEEAPQTAAELEAALQKAEAELPQDSPLRGLLAALRQVPPQELLDYFAALGQGRQVPPPESLTRALLPWLLAQDPKTLLARFKDLEVAQKFRRVGLDELGVPEGSPEERERALNERLNQGKLFAYFVIPEDPIGQPLPGDGAGDSGEFRYVSNNQTDNDLRQWYARAATEVVQEKRIARAGIAPETARWIQQRVTFRELKVGETGATEAVTQSEKANKFAPVGFVYLLWIAVFTAAQMLLTNTVEEKSNRIIEVLLSSVSPLELMSGKIWGIAATGLTIVGSWVVFALIGVKLAPVLFPGLGDFPLMDVIGDPLYLASFVGYFLGGYLLYAAILVALGSVCNSLKEAQNLLQPVFILLIVPLVAMFPIVQEPNGTVAKVLTYIPLFTPFTMMNRAGGPPPTWEYLLSGVIIVASVALAFWAAGKIFRIGILMTGKPPRLKEILGWLRAPVV